MENYLKNKYSISSHSISVDNSIYHSGVGSAKNVSSSSDTLEFLQNINIGNTNSYNLIAYAYTDGSAVSDSDVELYYNGSAVSTTYTSVGSGWYNWQQ